MEQRINGKRYNIDRAKYLGEYTNGKDISSDDYIVEKLYRKITGEFFLFCEGGPNTVYAQKVKYQKKERNTRYVPLTYDEAEFWVKSKMPDDFYKELFDNEYDCENQPKVALRLDISRKSFNKLKRITTQYNITYGEFIEDAINQSKM